MSESGALTARAVSVGSMPGRLLVPLTIFVGAFLLFGVQPLIAKMILPWFGGSAEVWLVSLLFFQSALLAGYLYAHLLNTRLPAAWQWRVHLVLLLLSLAFLPIIPSESWKPEGGEPPLPLILGTLASTIGLPFVLLSSTGPLIQAWLSRSRPGAPGGGYAIYRLYALSNLGSLLALLLYPVLIEPSLPTQVQAFSWSAIYGAFVLLSALSAWSYRSAVAHLPTAAGPAEPSPTIGLRALWFLLAMGGSALLLAMTNHLSRNIAAIPLLWVIPLSLYLLSFIIAFDHPRWYFRPLWYTLFAIASGGMIFVLGLFLAGDITQLALFAGGLFVLCMVCHGELAALKPPPAYLTAFYLTIAAGGAAGGLFVAAIAPAVFTDDFDLALILGAVTLLVIGVVWRHVPRDMPHWLRWTTLLVILYAWGYLTGTVGIRIYQDARYNLFLDRNFYGPLRVAIRPANSMTGELVQLRNGNIIHGREFTAPERHCEPISYYSPDSGIGVTLREKAKDGPVKVGVIGLGAGMIAGYGRAGDAFRFYEINPLVREVATRYFYYLSSCPAEWTIAMGDARLSLEREPPQQFDVLAVDAFTSDAIPVHLLTREAFDLYWRHLKRDGVLAVHVSNRYVDLVPVVAVAAVQSGKAVRVVENFMDVSKAIDAATWVLVVEDESFFARPLLASAKVVSVASVPRVWTDDYSNLWQTLR